MAASTNKYYLLALLVSLFSVAYAYEYYSHEKVPILVNTVGPFNNPAETYKVYTIGLKMLVPLTIDPTTFFYLTQYYSLPFCSPKKTLDQGENLGEVLAGDRRRNSLYDVRYKGH